MTQSFSPRGAEDRPLSELISDLTSKIQLLLRKELELAKIEITEQAARAGQAAAMFVVAGVMGFVALLMLSFAAAWGLAEVLPTGVGFLIVGIVFVLAAVGLLAKGKKLAAGMKPVPEQTVETLKEDVEVAKRSFKRGMQSDAGPGRLGPGGGRR